MTIRIYLRSGTTLATDSFDSLEDFWDAVRSAGFQGFLLLKRRADPDDRSMIILVQGIDGAEEAI